MRAKITVLALPLLAFLAVLGGVAFDGLLCIRRELKSLHRNILPLDWMIENWPAGKRRYTVH